MVVVEVDVVVDVVVDVESGPVVVVVLEGDVVVDDGRGSVVVAIDRQQWLPLVVVDDVRRDGAPAAVAVAGGAEPGDAAVAPYGAAPLPAVAAAATSGGAMAMAAREVPCGSRSDVRCPSLGSVPPAVTGNTAADRSACPPVPFGRVAVTGPDTRWTAASTVALTSTAATRVRAAHSRPAGSRRHTHRILPPVVELTP